MYDKKFGVYLETLYLCIAKLKETLIMELRHLVSFVAVADTGNITNAAKRCSITQSAVSHHIKALEKEIGATLFERRKKGDIVLTESGKAAVRHARNIIKESKECFEEVSSINGHICGELNIGVGSFIEPYIREVSLKFMKKYPDVLLHAQFSHAQVLNEALRNRSLDLAFTMNTAYNNEGIVSTPCIPFYLSAIMSVNHKFAKKEKLTFDDLMQCKVIMPDVGERVFNTFQKYTQFDLSKLNVAAIVSAPDAAFKACENTEYVTFLPSDYVANSETMVAIPIETLDKQLMSNSHWMKDMQLKESAKRFLDIINEITKNER